MSEGALDRAPPKYNGAVTAMRRSPPALFATAAFVVAGVVGATCTVDKAGLSTPDDLSADMAAAADLERDISALVAGHDAVSRGQARPS